MYGIRDGGIGCYMLVTLHRDTAIANSGILEVFVNIQSAVMTFRSVDL